MAVVVGELSRSSSFAEAMGRDVTSGRCLTQSPEARPPKLNCEFDA